jgi:hypothetical protein
VVCVLLTWTGAVNRNSQFLRILLKKIIGIAKRGG